MGFFDGPTIVTNGLVLSLDAADNNSYPGSGTTWRDLTNPASSVATGSLVNGPTFNTGNGGNIVFDGTNDYVNLPVIDTNSAFTLDFWLMRFDAGSATMISGGVTPSTNGYLQIANFSGAVTLRKSSVAELGNFGASTATLSNVIYNITVTRSGTTFSCYINGDFKNTLTVVQTFTTARPALGQTEILVNEPYAGRMYRFSHYNRALSSNEVLQNYNAQKSRFGL